MQSNFKVNRPLLNVHRFEIRQFVRFWKLPIYSDPSNQKTNYLRNKVRKQLIPTLRIFFNPQLDTVLLNFVEIQKNEQLYFQSVLKSLLKPQECHPSFVFNFYLSINAYRATRYFNLQMQSHLRMPSDLGMRNDLRCDANLTEGRMRSKSFFTSEALTNQRFVDYFRSQRRTKTQNSNSLAYRIRDSFATPICDQVSGTTEDKGCFYKSAKLTIQRKDYLNYFSRNQIIYWLIINNNLIKRLNSYPNIFQKQVLKTILKTFDQVENVVRDENKISSFFNFSDFFKYANTKHQTLTSSTFGLGSTLRRASLVVTESEGKEAHQVKYRRVPKDPGDAKPVLPYQISKNLKNKKKITTSTYFQSGGTRRNQQFNEKILRQLLILKFTKKLFIIREKKFLLFILRNLINKY